MSAAPTPTPTEWDYSDLAYVIGRATGRELGHEPELGPAPDPTRDAVNTYTDRDAAHAATGVALERLGQPRVYPDVANAYALVGITHALLDVAAAIRERRP